MNLYYQFYPKNTDSRLLSDVPVMILPGLFGSTSNWRSFARKLSQTVAVYVLDHRNHGHSPHADSHSYNDMVQDLLEFVDQQRIERIILCGHSMGGKVAMLFSLFYPQRVDKLMVLDIAPVTYNHSHAPFLDAMMALNLSDYKSRSEIDKALKPEITDTATRLFLLQSLDGSGGNYRWRINVVALKQNMSRIMGFPESLIEGKHADMSARFISGGMSDYVKPQHHALIRQHFSQAEFVTIDKAGHWLHVEQAQAVLDSVIDFII